MPSPFPGMDPYIEDQGYWPDFHARFVPYCCDVLNERLPDAYVARLEEIVRLVDFEEEGPQPRRPDVAVEVLEHGAPAEGGGGVAVAVAAPPDIITATVPLPQVQLEVREVWIEIYRRPGRKLVTVVEVLSPTNKAGTGLGEYLQKRRALIRQDVNLVEIDLLLGGHRLPMGRPLPPGDYYALVARAERRPNCDVAAWSIRRALPTLLIPLRPPDPDVPLDLAAVFATAYERGRYARDLDYAAPLQVPLAEADREWARAIVRAGRA